MEVGFPVGGGELQPADFTFPVAEAFLVVHHAELVPTEFIGIHAEVVTTGHPGMVAGPRFLDR